MDIPLTTPAPFYGTVVIAGATGFVGRHLVLSLVNQGAKVIVLSRNPLGAQQLFGRHAQAYVDIRNDRAVRRHLDGADALVNLAGASLFSRWTRTYKKRLRESRVDLSRRLARLCLGCATPPRCVVSTSAVGYYGVGEQDCNEQSPAGKDFLAKLCRDWEEAWNAARAAGIRVVHPRLGIVLGVEEGMMAKLSLPMAHGIAPLFGNGQHFLSWVHIQDVVRFLQWSIRSNAVAGPYNLCAPHPVRYRECIAALRRVIPSKREFTLPIPAWILRGVAGEMSMLLTKGQRVLPQRALAESFAFVHPTMDQAAAALMDQGSFEVLDRLGQLPDNAYLQERQPDRCLVHTMVVDAPIEEVSAFFSDPVNLAALTPSGMKIEFLGPPPKSLSPGDQFSMQVRPGPVPFKWTVELQSMRPPYGFVDVQLRGPYACWYHEHRFSALGSNKTQVSDIVLYRVGFSNPFATALFGGIEERLVRPALERIFAARRALTRARFAGKSGESSELRATIAEIIDTAFSDLR